MSTPTLSTSRTLRLKIFATAADALSNVSIRTGEIAMIEGDPNSFRLGVGQKVSFDTPAANMALAYSSSPRINTIPVFGNASALNATGPLTAALLMKRYITTTSAAAVTATLDTAANIATAIGNVVQGQEFDFTIDNLAGANTLTVALGTNITQAAAAVITGSATLTVAAGVIGKFKLVFKDTSHALLYRTL